MVGVENKERGVRRGTMVSVVVLRMSLMGHYRVVGDIRSSAIGGVHVVGVSDALGLV